MRSDQLLVPLAVVVAGCFVDVTYGQDVFIAVEGKDGTLGESLAVNLAVFEKELTSAGLKRNKEDATLMKILFDETACRELDIEDFPVTEEPFALATNRGDCAFATKALNAKSIGASALLVFNSEDSLYNSSTNTLFNPCSLNCDIASSKDRNECESDCPTSKCLSNPLDSPSADFCCLLNNGLNMDITGNSSDTSEITGVFVGFLHRERIMDALDSDLRIAIFLQGDMNFDGSMFGILLLGSLVVSWASYRAAKPERNRAKRLWQKVITSASDDSEERNEDRGAAKSLHNEDDAIESVTLNLFAVSVFIVFCSGALIGLFYLSQKFPSQTVIAIQVLFGLSAIYPVSHFFIQPMVRHFWAKSHETTVRVVWNLGSADEVIGTSFATILVVLWFTLRHVDEISWILLDILAAAVCCMFLVSIRLPNLRLACIMLALFFVYDVFMVFLSPLVFGGRSVMVDVATAGQSVPVADTTNLVCERTQTERMPMLFMIPRFSGDGFALLGLGDIFIPGLLITYACRFDYLKAESLGMKASSPWRLNQYFFPLCFAYFSGLLVTLLANLFQLNFSTQVKGQPALLYLVPFTLITFLGLAHVRGDLRNLWNYNYEQLETIMLGQGATSQPRDIEAEEHDRLTEVIGTESSEGIASSSSSSHEGQEDVVRDDQNNRSSSP